eukprot:15456625-Alexandrium_andersonii.AAC.1
MRNCSALRPMSGEGPPLSEPCESTPLGPLSARSEEGCCLPCPACLRKWPAAKFALSWSVE